MSVDSNWIGVLADVAVTVSVTVFHFISPRDDALLESL